MSRRRTKRPVYSPKHEYKDTDWQLMQSEVDCIDAALDGFCRKVVLQGKEGKRTTVSNEGLLCLMLEKGGRAAEMAMNIKARPGGAKKVGDHIRTHLQTLGYGKR